MTRPDLRFNPPPPPVGPVLDVSFSDSTPDSAPQVIDLRDGPVLTENEARAILGVADDAGWDDLRAAFRRRSHALAGERRRVNTAYATLRLLASGSARTGR